MTTIVRQGYRRWAHSAGRGAFLLALSIMLASVTSVRYTPMLTATSPRDVDLTITELRIVPPNPTPGQQATISMTLKNKGTTDSGPFKWAWFARITDPNAPPAIVGEVQNLGPDEAQVVKSDYYFGMWGTYLTEGWVNFDHKVPDTNPLNDLMVQAVTTSNDPMVVDFTRLPTGDAFTNSQSITGGEFSAWGFHIALAPSTNPNCKDAGLRVNVGDTFNELVVGTPQQPADCNDLPITFMLDLPVGGASLRFFASSPGEYTLDLFDAGGTDLQSSTVTADSANQTLEVSATDSGSKAQKVVFTPPRGAATVIQTITFFPPKSSPAPTPNH